MKKSEFKSIVFIVLLSFAVLQSFAQYQISGKVMQKSEKESPLSFANVELTISDSVYIAGMNGDENGNFRFKNVAAGNYRITVSYLGFSSQTIVLNGLSKSVDLGNIVMEESVNQLKDVTITASNTVNKTDRMIVFVTDEQKAHSSNGINLLTTMQLPRLTVNPITNEVTLPGGETIQFCINSVKVELSDIRALQPGDILRIEYIDNPGVRYGNAAVVINYLLKRNLTGGSGGLDLGNAITTGFANDMATFKINYKKSEFGLNYSLRYVKPTKVWADEEQTFNFADGSSMTRFTNGSAADKREEDNNIALNYNLMDKKYYFNATFRFGGLYDDKIRYSSQYISLTPDDITQVKQGSNSRQFLPSLDLYYFRSLANKQSLIFNVVGTYIHSIINQQYNETKGEQQITDILSDITGKKYSIIGEGIYEKQLENSGRFTAGLKHTQAFADNDYTGTENAQTKMNQAETYVYAEYAGKKNKFSYIGGIGLSRAYAKQEGESDYTSYIFRPKLTLQYDFTNSTFLRLRGEVYNSLPSLSDLSAIDQYIDTLQIMRGNPLLKPNVNYYTNLLFNWKKGIYGINFNFNYDYKPNAIMETVLREDDKFIRTNENQKSWQKVNNELTLSAGPIKKYVMLSLTGGLNYYISDGNDYFHTYSNFYLRAQLIGFYKKFTGVFQLQTPNSYFFGETLNGGENMHLFMLSYNAGKYTVGAGIMLPFSNQYTRYGENRNSYMPYTTTAYSNDLARMVLLQFRWNFDFGRKVKSEDKRINNSDSDSGIVRSVK
ncbi:MAG: carboxypeptidase-like regulatory domain-containing protein [Candidatus Azobacteroides sp.]|nr:carboxypeptidase-like regulatory domain-containing protein [Candidatus Azobacteroides sp.]